MCTLFSSLSMVITLYNVFSTSGDFSTSRGIQYIGGYHGTSGHIMMHVGGYHEYIGGCSVRQGMS